MRGDVSLEGRIILLDLGGVLIEVVSMQRLGELMKGAMPHDEVAERWSKSRYLRLFESGRCGRDEFARGIVEEICLDMPPDEFMAEFDLFLKGFYPGAETLLGELERSGYRLACLTDTNAFQWSSLCRRTAIDRYFGRCFLSYEIGTTKPDPGVYRHVIEGLGCGLGEILYFDDREDNVRAGEKAGMKSYLAEGVGGLSQRLRELKLI